MTANRICAWCGKELGDSPGITDDTGCICPTCYEIEVAKIPAKPDSEAITRIGLAISFEWPELAVRVGEAIRLVEAGRVKRQGPDSYYVEPLFYRLERPVFKRHDTVHIPPGWLTQTTSGRYWCGCDDYVNGVLHGYHYSPRVKFTPGHTGPVCCHCLAVEIYKRLEQQEGSTNV